MPVSEKYEEKMSRAPLEIYAALRKGKAFGIENGISPAGQNGDSNSPVELFSNFSRFPIKLISDGKIAIANINVKIVPVLRKKTDACVEKTLSDELELLSCGNSMPDSPAYTVKMVMGKNTKGKTPAQFILEKGESGADSQINELRNLYSWIKGNLEKDPCSKYAENNRNQMNAIAEAAQLYKEGKLSLSSSSTNGVYTIYDSGFRPLTGRKQKNGKTFVYEYSIKWVFGNDSPVLINIKNYYATVIKKDDGRLNVQSGTTEDMMDFSMYLTSEEWLWAMHMMEASMQSFEIGYGPKALATCQKRSFENAQKAKTEDNVNA